MKILQVITDTDRRGAQVFATDLGAALVARGHEVRTVALARGARSPALDVQVLGATSRGLSTLRALRRAMKTVDVTIAHGSSTLLACALAGAGPGRPFVYRQISDSRFWAPSLLRRMRVAAYLRAPRTVVALSAAARKSLVEYLKVPARRICVVPNGVPRAGFLPATPAQRAAARAQLGLPADALVAVYVGALVQEKGVDVAVRAVAQVPELRLAIVGGGPDRERLESLVHDVGEGRVHFLGDLDEPVIAYHASDISLLASRSEAMPATLIEAGFCRLPTVSTLVGSIDEIVLDERTGLLVPPNDVDGLVGALGRMVNDQSLRDEFGAAAEAHCLEHFEIDVVAQGWEAACSRSQLSSISTAHRR